MKRVTLEPATATHLDRLLELNNQAVPDVNRLELPALQRFLDCAPYFKVAVTDDAVLGFLIALTPDIRYASPNFTWFRSRYDRFLYIDRIVIAARARSAGLGRRFYRDLESSAAGRAPRLACEVNLRPRNEASLRFHRRFGFVEVGRQDTDNGAKTVSLMIKELGD